MALLRKFWMELRSLIVLGAAYYLFRDANFTVFQSLLLACLATFTLSWIFVSNKHARRYKFEPFRFAFRINWYDLLRDYKIVDEEGWKRLCEKAQSQPKEEHRFLTASQTTFTRIGPTLTYIDEVRKFTSRIDWNQFLEEIEAGDEQQRRYGWHPRFYVKESSDKHPSLGTVRTLEFGLVTPESSKKSVHWADDRDLVPFAKLPDALFNDYYADDNFTLNQNVAKHVPELLEHYGWASEKDKGYDGPRIAQELNHKYVTVWYREI